MQLSKRLLAVANLVTTGKRLADVGTDHAYIPIYLIQKKQVTKAIAMDIGKGPLQRAKENIQSHGLGEQIETRCSDGVDKLAVGEVDTVVIAGMGGNLVIRIVTAGEDVLKNVSELILQPQSDIGLVRRFLQSNNYQICKEDMVVEDGKYYPMMCVSHGKMTELSELEYEYGPLLLKMKNPCLKQFLEREQEQYQEIRKKLQKNMTDKTKVRLAEVEVKLQQIERARANYQ